MAFADVRVKLTHARVTALSCTPGQKSIMRTDVSGNLVIYVSPRSKIWRYRFRFNGGKPEIMSLGKWPDMTYEEAKTKVAALERHRASGLHPRSFDVKPTSIASVGDVLDYHLSTLQNPDNRRGVTSLYRPIRDAHGTLSVIEFRRRLAAEWITANYEQRKGAGRSLIRNLTAAFNLSMDSMSGLMIPPEYEHPTARISQHIPWLSTSRPGTLSVAWEEDEWRKLLGALANGYRDPSIDNAGVMVLELLVLTGARPSEIKSLRWAEIEPIDLDGITGDHIIKERHKLWARTNRPRRIYLSAEASTVLEKAREHRESTGYEGPYVFPSSRSVRGQKVEHVSQLTDIAHRVGKRGGFDFKPYNLRSAYINYAVETLGEGAIAVVAENVGHTDVATTMKYYRRHRATVRAEAAQQVGDSFRPLLDGALVRRNTSSAAPGRDLKKAHSHRLRELSIEGECLSAPV